jgi:hypothetical protein
MLGIIGVLACDSTQPSISAPQNPSSTSSGLGLGAEILSLMGGFPKGESTSVNAKWDHVLRSLATEPKVTLKGKLVPGSGGRAELIKTVDYIRLKTGDATPPAGETKAHFAARLILDMSLYVYGGPDTPVPGIAPGGDVAFKLVQPGTTDTVVTPVNQAAVIFPPGSVGEPTVVVITPDSAYYPANCSGPLDTHLCQYPRFYRYNVFPDVKLGVPAKVQLCHVDAGVNRRPLADHDRFRFAHVKPANPADNTAGSTIVDNVEILPLTPMAVTTCAAGDGTTYIPPISANLTPMGRVTNLAMGLLHNATVVARRLLVPEDVYAIDVGLGGFVDDFSMFGIVDPQGIADLAQSTPQFSLASPSLTTGGAAQIGTWAVRNVGSATSTAFTSSVIIATDSLLTTPVATFAAGGVAAAIVPGSSFTYPAISITLPPAVVPGTYFIGTKVLPTSADSSASDNLVSVRVVVSAPVLTQTVGAATWTGSGPGTVNATVNNPNLVTLGYGFIYSADENIVNIDGHSVFPWQTWTYSTNAVSSGTYRFDWNYTGYHHTFNAYAKLEAFASGPSGEVVVPLVPYVSYDGNYGNVQEGFTFTGTTTLTLTAGYAWGIRPSGYNYDSFRELRGTVTLTDPVFIP